MKLVDNYYQKHKERLQRKNVKDIKILPKKKKDKRQNKIQDRYQNLFAKQKKKALISS